MHTFIGKSCRIHYNPDLSGPAIITAKGKEIEVLAKDLKDFIKEVSALWSEMMQEE